jgi:hypothetical protein
VIVEGRWCWNANRSRLVREGDPEAAFLAYPAGVSISDEEARRVGLPVDPVQVPERKSVRKPADKMMPAPSDK